MRRADLAKRLIDARDERERKQLLANNGRLADEGLAAEIRRACYAAWAVDPVRAQRAAAAVKTLSKFNDSEDVRASVFWVNGISEITRGKFESAVLSLDNAAETLKKAGRINEAAQAQVASLLALAMLGRYDEAIQMGKKALKFFVAERDHLAAGKIAMNLSNIVSRQALHHKAQKYGEAARRHFKRSGEQSWLAMAENGLANTYAELNEFSRAERFYRSALAIARIEKMPVTEAEIEASLGNLAILRGRYADALKYLELSRQRYDDLSMPHQSAIAELEIADIYLELNLLAEAVELYNRTTAVFRRLKLRAEEARSRLNHGRAALKLVEVKNANTQLKHALRLFRQEKNVSGEVSARLAQAELELGLKHIDAAQTILASAAHALKQDDNPRHIINFKLLEGEAFRSSGQAAKSERALLAAGRIASKRNQTNSEQSALNSLGKLSLERGENAKARSYFTRAVKIVEGLRAPLAAAEFGMSFLASRLEPFENLAKLYLQEGKIGQALGALEQGRSRSLLDALDVSSGKSAAPLKLRDQARGIRSELNFHYKKFDRSTIAEASRIRTDIDRAEAALAGLKRQIDSLSSKGVSRDENHRRFDLKSLQRELGTTGTLIEFMVSDGEIGAFIVNANRVKFVSGLGTTDALNLLLEDLHFQFGALRYGTAPVLRFLGQMKQRTDACLRRIYDQLLGPIEKYLAGTRLIIIPAGPLHYVPFQALHNGSSYVAEHFEISYAPSAAVWMHLAKKRSKKPLTSLLVGYADERIPLVENEIRAIDKILPGSKTLVGSKASFSAFTDNVSAFDLIHIACHGKFRPDNPMFSSLHLADGWVTVQDICSHKLKASLVTLSACETGLNKIYAGDEILGLARGFLSAGAASLVVSLWTVNDEAAAVLMKNFYKNLQLGMPVSASLRSSQLDFINRGKHPYLWSPFVLIGR